MYSLQLRKIIRKQEVRSLLENSIESLHTPINLFDTEGNLLWGELAPNLPRQFILKAGDQVLGWVRGEDRASYIAQLLNYIANREAEKKSLAIETLEKYEEINFLYDISAKISKCLEIEEITAIVIREIKQLIEATRVSVLLIAPDTGELEVVATDHPRSNPRTLGRMGIDYHVFQSGQAEIVNDVLNDSRYIQGTSKIRSLICAPLTVQNETIGVIKISHSQPLQYKAEDLKLFAALTSQAAAAIKTAQYYERLKEYSQTLEQKVAERTVELEKAKQELEKAILDLEELATSDQLTGLANRRKFDEFFALEWSRMYRECQPLALILCDVDYFKNYNDHYGHPAGDECLKRVAASLRAVVKRSRDLVARYGGEEFAIILPNTDASGAAQIAKEIGRAIERCQIPHALSIVNPVVTVSLGIAIGIPCERNPSEHFLNTADECLYRSKNSGRNRYCWQEL